MPASQIDIPNRPFASDLFTGIMLPDGIFVNLLGEQVINIHLTNQTNSLSPGGIVYIESASHPSIGVTGSSHPIPPLQGGAATVLSWRADFQNCPSGKHYVSFIFDDNGARKRIIKRIFVLGLKYNSTDKSFVATTPEGEMRTYFHKLVEPKDDCCAFSTRKESNREKDSTMRVNPAFAHRPTTSSVSLTDFFRLATHHIPDFKFCPPGYLPLDISYQWTPTPPYEGVHGDLPFQDPYHKVVLCVIAVLLLIIAGLVAAFGGGGGSVGVSGGSGGAGTSDPTDPTAPGSCCGVTASGGSSSYVVAGLVAAAAAAATAAGLSDARDYFLIGQDQTPPKDGELTVKERFAAKFKYLEAVEPGKPFAVEVQFHYQRHTTEDIYEYGSKLTNKNVHLLSEYHVEAPEFAYRGQNKPWIVKARFLDQNNQAIFGSRLFVRCLLSGPGGVWQEFTLQDDGLREDDKANDGVYTGHFWFRRKDLPEGMWSYYIIAQDVNDATPDLPPQEAAKIIGGMVLTNQLTINFDTDECAFVPDGHVMVV